MNLLHQAYGKLKVISYGGLGKQKYPRPMWLCECKCGVTKLYAQNHLRSGVYKHCGCENKQLKPLKDLTGHRFGRWVVLGYAGKSRYKCRCDCGVGKIVRNRWLQNGDSQSCGCFAKEMTSQLATKDLTGKRFGRLLVTKKLAPRKWRNYWWKCLCDCGSVVEVVGGQLTRGKKNSCGCITKELNRSMSLEERWRRSVKASLTHRKNSAVLKHWKTKVNVPCNGGYETAVIEYLNKNCIDYTWQIPFSLSNGRIYICDLFLKSENKYVEIKGYARDVFKKKWELFQVVHQNSEIWSKVELKAKGIL